MNYFLPFFVICLTVFSTKCQKFCNGVYCDENCTNCYPCQQEINCFIAKNCFCAKKTIPGGLPLADTPQFFFLTIDDSIKTIDFVNTLQSLNFLRNNPKIHDSMSCTPKISAYLLEDGF